MTTKPSYRRFRPGRPGSIGLCTMTAALLISMAFFCSSGKAWARVAVPRAYTDVQAHVVLQSAGQQQCDAPAPYNGKMSFRSRYEGSGKARDTVNKDAEKAYLKKTVDVSALQRFLAKKTDRIVKGHGTTQDLDCITSTLLEWARGSSLLDTTDNHTAKAVRKWTLAAVSSNLLKINDILERHEDRNDISEIQNWISQLADTVVADYSTTPLAKINNHHYWAAWAVMSSAGLLDRDDLYQWSRNMFVTAMSQVDGNGYLPNELRRMSRAGLYHNYALSPLTGIAIFLEANGSDPFAINNSAYPRLLSRVLDGVESPEHYRLVTGAKQADSNMKKNGRLAWLAMYSVIAYLGPADLAERCTGLAETEIPLQSSRLGGDLRFLFMK